MSTEEREIPVDVIVKFLELDAEFGDDVRDRVEHIRSMQHDVYFGPLEGYEKAQRIRDASLKIIEEMGEKPNPQVMGNLDSIMTEHANGLYAVLEEIFVKEYPACYDMTNTDFEKQIVANTAVEDYLTYTEHSALSRVEAAHRNPVMDAKLRAGVRGIIDKYLTVEMVDTMANRDGQDAESKAETKEYFTNMLKFFDKDEKTPVHDALLKYVK